MSVKQKLQNEVQGKTQVERKASKLDSETAGANCYLYCGAVECSCNWEAYCFVLYSLRWTWMYATPLPKKIY